MFRRFLACIVVTLCTGLAWFLGFWIESCFDDIALQLQIVLPILVIGLSLLWTLMRCMEGEKPGNTSVDTEKTTYRFRIK